MHAIHSDNLNKDNEIQTIYPGHTLRFLNEKENASNMTGKIEE